MSRVLVPQNTRPGWRCPRKCAWLTMTKHEVEQLWRLMFPLITFDSFWLLHPKAVPGSVFHPQLLTHNPKFSGQFTQLLKGSVYNPSSCCHLPSFPSPSSWRASSYPGRKRSFVRTPDNTRGLWRIYRYSIDKTFDVWMGRKKGHYQKIVLKSKPVAQCQSPLLLYTLIAIWTHPSSGCRGAVGGQIPIIVGA